MTEKELDELIEQKKAQIQAIEFNKGSVRSFAHILD